MFQVELHYFAVGVFVLGPRNCFDFKLLICRDDHEMYTVLKRKC